MDKPMNKRGVSSYPGIEIGQKSRVKDYLQMFKLHLCLYISLSGILGHATSFGRFSVLSFFLGISVLILSLGSAVLNNIQDRQYDRAFIRTANRSLPLKKVPLPHAIFIAATMIVTGLCLLFYLGSWPCFFTGVMAVIAYNGLYTPLKKKTLLAIIPGTLSGMMPVLIGWTGTGTFVFDMNLVMLMLILGLWQIPHFFIIVLRTENKKHPKYAQHSFPCFTDWMTLSEIRVQVVLWTSLYSLAIFYFLLSNAFDIVWIASICGLNALGVLIFMWVSVLSFQRVKLSYAFAAINLSMLFFLGAGICNTFLI